MCRYYFGRNGLTCAEIKSFVVDAEIEGTPADEKHVELIAADIPTPIIYKELMILPKTKDAFAFQDIMRNINFLVFDSDNGVSENILNFLLEGTNSWDNPLAKILDGNRADNFTYRNAFQARQHTIERIKSRLNRVEVAMKRIDNHCRRLSILKDRLSEEIIKTVDDTEMKEKLKRVMFRIADYQTIQRIFENYLRDIEKMLPVLKKDLPKLFAKEVGLKIRAARNKKGLTQEKFAEYLGINRQAYYFIENGLRTPSLYLLSQITDYLEITISELFNN